MQRLILIMVLAILCLFSLTAQTCEEVEENQIEIKNSVIADKSDLIFDDFIIIRKSDGLRIIFRNSASEIMESLGEYTIDVYENSSDSKWDELTYLFDGIKIGHYRNWDDITYIEIISDCFTTYRGIKIGDSVEKIGEKYKIHINGDWILTVPNYFDKNSNHEYFLTFKIRNETVEKIILGLTID